MATCEKCGTSFTMPPQTGEVTSARVLCPPCAAERQAAKAAARATAARSTTGARAAAAQAPAPPAARPAPPPPLPVARPTPPPARPTTPPAPANHPTGATSARRPTTARSTRRESVIVQAQVNRTTTIGMIAAGAVVLIAAVIVAIYFATDKAKKTAEQQRIDEIKAFHKSLTDLDLSNVENAQKALLVLAEDAKKEKPIQQEDYKNYSKEYQSIRVRAQQTIDQDTERKDVARRLKIVEDLLASPETRTSDELADARRKIEELEPKQDLMGAEFTAKLDQLREVSDRVLIDKLLTEARDFVAANPDKKRLALSKHYARAEEELLKTFEKHFRDPDQTKRRKYEEMYRNLITESDQLADATYTPEAVAQTTPKDLLGPDLPPDYWRRSPTPGLEVRVEGGVMTIKGPDPAAAGGNQGVIHTGGMGAWRDFVIEMEFVIEKGSFNLIPRMGKNYQTSESIPFIAADTALQAGKSYAVTISFIGSRLIVTYRNGEADGMDLLTRWGYTRKGDLVLAISEGALIKITKLKIRELR